MMNATRLFCSLLSVAVLTACTGRYPNAQRTLLSVAGYGVSLEVLQSSASSPTNHPESEVTVGKWASQIKRGSVNSLGSLAAPGPAPVDWTAVTGGVGVITVTRVAAIPAGATQMYFRAVDTTTGAIAINWSLTLTGLVSGRAYRVSAAWWNATNQISEASPYTVVNAG